MDLPYFVKFSSLLAFSLQQGCGAEDQAILDD